MEQDPLHEAAIALQRDWDLQLPDNISEEEILRVLANRVVVLLERGAESFFQLMYRLDISEKKLNQAMEETEVAQSIARLIYDRQLQKIHSRKMFKTKESDDPELRW